MYALTNPASARTLDDDQLRRLVPSVFAPAP
jgi:hypothetical protein